MKAKKSLLVVLICAGIFNVYAQLPSFPGALGFGASATGGRGGKVIYVTNTNISGPGSLQEALNESGKRYILFKVSGVINGTVEVPSGHGDFTLAGQTSPNGIVVRGFQSYNDEDKSSSNFIIRHLRSRIGTLQLLPTNHWLAADGITLGGVHHAMIDHCSFGQANDEAVDISRSSALTIQNCLFSETLGGHAYLGGMLINYSSAQSRLDSLTVVHNIWNRIGGRMPEISCESPYCNGKTLNIELSNNVFYDPRIELWYEGITGSGNFYVNLNAVNNLSHSRSNYNNGMFHHDLLHFPQNNLFFSGNELSQYPGFADYDLFYCCNDFDTSFPNTDFGLANRRNVRHGFPTMAYVATNQLLSYSFNNMGAFPRDVMDTRLMQHVANKTFDNQSIDEDHYRDAFSINQSGAAPADSDNDGMPDYWEIFHGLNQNIQDHNETSLSMKIYGVEGYTNVECYLNCLSDYLVHQHYDAVCGINAVSTETYFEKDHTALNLFPNPTRGMVNIDLPKMQESLDIQIFDYMGRLVKKVKATDKRVAIDLTSMQGIYLVKVGNETKQLLVID